jgi:DNA-binding Lrp family transcriptional regulator
MFGLLARNVRTTYKDLAKQLHISIHAVQRRLSNIESQRQILDYRANLNIDILGWIRVVLLGEIKGKLDKDILTNAGSHRSFPYLGYGTSNNLFMVTLLRNISEMGDILSYAERSCRMSNPQVIIHGHGSIWGGGLEVYDPIDDELHPSRIWTLEK